MQLALENRELHLFVLVVILTDEVLDAGVFTIGACLFVSAVTADAVVALQQSVRTPAM